MGLCLHQNMLRSRSPVRNQEPSVVSVSPAEPTLSEPKAKSLSVLTDRWTIIRRNQYNCRRRKYSKNHKFSNSWTSDQEFSVNAFGYSGGSTYTVTLTGFKSKDGITMPDYIFFHDHAGGIGRQKLKTAVL